MTLSNMRRRDSAFTLVELLVVIGIIALLLAILLPALNKARESANMIKCMATLRNMGQAAHLHAAEHNGFMPLAGALIVVADDRSPAGIGDPLRRKYTYFRDESNSDGQGIPRDSLAPLSAALAKCMNLSVDLGSRKGLQASLREESLIRAFSCPSDTNPPTPASTIVYNGTDDRTPDELMSYLFNSAVLGGGRGVDPSIVPAGKISKVRRPAEVFLFCDGKRAQQPQFAYEVSCSGDETLSGSLFDYWSRGGTSGNHGLFPTFDYVRHRKRANVVFVDGHVETIILPTIGVASVVENSYADFKRIGVSKGVYQ